MRIKEIPEDFQVDEMEEHRLVPSGEFILVRMRKREMTTEDAVATLVNILHIPRNAIAYAGAKDAHAVTTQYLTIRATSAMEDHITQFSHQRIGLELIGRVREPLGLGLLSSNRFTITVRNLKEERLHELQAIPNYYDEQRFSTSNAAIGKLLVQKKFLDAARLIITSDSILASPLSKHLAQLPSDAIGALRLVPRHTMLMYVHAYQSLLYNEVLRSYVLECDPNALRIDGSITLLIPSKEIPNVPIPILGFASELAAPFAAWYEQILQREGIGQRDFVIKQIPFLTVEGSTRDALVIPQDLRVGEREPDELHSGSEKQTLTFSLPRGAYATIAIKCFYRIGTFEENA